MTSWKTCLTLEQDNAFGNEEEDLEFRLYQQFYFEPNPDLDETNTKNGSLTLKHHDEMTVSEVRSKQYVQHDKHQLNDSLMNKSTLCSGRERLSSTCSDGSLSGSVPLDVLYCNIATPNGEDDNIITNKLIMKDINTNEQKRGKSKPQGKLNKKRKKSYSVDETEESRCDNLIRLTANNAVSKDDVYEVGEDSNSDHDLCILSPPESGHHEILTLESSSDEVNSGNKDGTRIKTKNNKYIKIDQPLASTLKNKTRKSESQEKQGEVECILADGSESDSNDIYMPEASKGTDLTLNIDKSLSGWIKTITKDSDTKKRKENVAKKAHKKIQRSSVDFTKGRPKTKRKPSCEKWTQSMANFYDSDVSDDIDVSKIHFEQSGARKDWHLIEKDLQVINKRRYYNALIKCKRCREEGHLISDCTRPPVCHLCSSTDHASRRNCPKNCCFKCGGDNHYFCPNTSRPSMCKLCGLSGHLKDICPDLWRRFHLTTSGLAVQAPTEHTRPKTKVYCCNCSKQGHYGYECPQGFQKQAYVQVPQLINSYDCPVKMKDGYLVVNWEGVQPAVQEANVTKLHIKSNDIPRIIGKKGIVINSISEETGAHLYVLPGNQSKVLVYGSPEARHKAEEKINVLVGNENKRCKAFVKPLHPIPVTNGLNECTSSISGSSDRSNSWCKKFVADLDKKKDCVRKEMMALLRIFKPRRRKNVYHSIEKLKSFKLRKISEPSLELSKVMRKHICEVARRYLAKEKFEGLNVDEKYVCLKKLIGQVSPSGDVPENICFEIASTVEPLFNTSIKKLDLLLNYAKSSKKKTAKKRRKNKSNKNANTCNVDTRPTGNKKVKKEKGVAKKEKKVKQTKKAKVKRKLRSNTNN